MIQTFQLVLGKRNRRSKLQKVGTYEYDEVYYNKPELVCKMMKEIFNLHLVAEEYVYMIALDASLKILGIFEVAHGGLSSALVDPRSIFIRACYIGAANIILVHNHPSGRTVFSREDRMLTERVKNGGDLLGIALIDHIVIGSNGYLSFYEGKMP